MALNKSQRKFIRKKVLELGTVDAVKGHYKGDCLVDRFANKFALRKLKKEKHRTIKRRKREI